MHNIYSSLPNSGSPRHGTASVGRPDCSVLSSFPQDVPHRLGLLQFLDVVDQSRHHVVVSSPIPDSKFYMALVGRLSVRRWVFRGWYLDGNL